MTSARNIARLKNVKFEKYKYTKPKNAQYVKINLLTNDSSKNISDEYMSYPDMLTNGINII